VARAYARRRSTPTDQLGTAVESVTVPWRITLTPIALQRTRWFQERSPPTLNDQPKAGARTLLPTEQLRHTFLDKGALCAGMIDRPQRPSNGALSEPVHDDIATPAKMGTTLC
jgi:hypothetical protein